MKFRELQELDRRLFDKRRRDGTACVLVHGQPGGGKSHLARQYVNKNRKKFSGGIFWIVSHLREERYQAFESIFQKAVSRESPDANTKLSGAGQSFIESVKAWFESRQEWLIVFDGVTVDTDAEVTDLAKFVPDSRNSSLIYVSRQRNLESKQRLLRPFSIRVPVLKVDDARKLLFKELHMKKPTEDEINSATKLVKQVDCLPLAIDAISHRIADTHEPLKRYSIKSFSANLKLEGTYNQILDDLQRLGHMEAWNLINVLAFFGQHVPVEMLHLGVRALQDLTVKTAEAEGKPELNVTFGILMRHALLERNEPESENTSSRDSLVEPEPIDMLKIHSVVQSFCRDSLDARNMLPEWLQHATQLLEHSYHAADFKIKQKKQPARVSDYRYYLAAIIDQEQVHCRRLHEHALHYESKRQSLTPIRAALEPLLEAVQNEIGMLEPGSSQESVNKTYQVSIFDRTTSSSDSIPSAPSANEIPTPPHRPSPLPLAHETLWGTDIRKPSLESPASIGSARGPRIVGHSPYQGFYDDFGYESDRETPRTTSHPMRKNLSEATERPLIMETQQPRDDEDWQVVSSPRRARKPPARRDLGSFRPTPARATRAEIDRRSATGVVAHSTERSGSNSSEAKMALSKVHSQSPPPSRQSLPDKVTSFWQRRPLASTTNIQRTWANVAAGQESHPRVQPLPATPVPPIIPPGIGHREQPSSPLITEIHLDDPVARPQLANSTHLSMGSSHEVSPRTQPVPSYYASPAMGSSASLSRPRYMNQETFQYPSPVVGPNPARLLYDNIDDNISISSKRPLPEEFGSDGQSLPYPTTPQTQVHPSNISPYPSYETYFPRSYLPSGYYSQPMSRDTSHQSRISAAETEPLHRPPYSTPLPNASFSVDPPSPRDRFPDGRPLRKSPRSDNTVPVSSNNITPYDLSQSLPGLGGWTHQRQDAHPMSRSSSGPGVAIEDASGHGLGIVPFDGHLRFGDHEPVNVEDARQRTWEWGSRLASDQRFSRSRDRGIRQAVHYSDIDTSRRYPEINLIPTQSSPDAMRALLGEMGR
ncbi:MAG: hypothetical protein Q9222_007001 [Ikaeria aurantiellina]